MKLAKDSVKQPLTIYTEIDKVNKKLQIMAVGQVENLYLQKTLTFDLKYLAEQYYRDNPDFPEFLRK